MSLPLPLTPAHRDLLKMVFNEMSFKYIIQSSFKDGMFSILEKANNQTKFVHWYELVLDHMLPLLADRIAKRNSTLWYTEYTKLIKMLFDKRYHLQNGIHPIDFVYEQYQNLKSSVQPENPTIEG